MGNDPAHHLSASLDPVTNYLIPCGFVSSFPYNCSVCLNKWERANEWRYIQTEYNQLAQFVESKPAFNEGFVLVFHFQIDLCRKFH